MALSDPATLRSAALSSIVMTNLPSDGSAPSEVACAGRKRMAAPGTLFHAAAAALIAAIGLLPDDINWRPLELTAPALTLVLTRTCTAPASRRKMGIPAVVCSEIAAQNSA